MPRTLRLIALLTGLVLLLAACSGGEEVSDLVEQAEQIASDAAAAGEAAADAAAEAGEAAAAAAQETAADAADAAAVTEGAAGADSTVSVIDAARCQSLAETLNSVGLEVAAATTGQSDMAALEAQAAAFVAAADEVPSDVADDFRVVADVFAQIGQTLGGLDIQPGQIPDAATIAALTSLSTQLADADYVTASSNVSAYFAAGCPDAK